MANGKRGIQRMINHNEHFPYQQLFVDQLAIPKKLLIKYKELGLNEEELVVILQVLRYLSEHKDFPTPKEIAEQMTISDQKCANILGHLIQRGLLAIHQHENEQHQITEAYSIDPLIEKLYMKEEKEGEEEGEQIGTIFILFEQEFGRPLSPFEIETINVWLDEDNIKPALIKAALRESVLMGKLNFKYIDRILREWKKKGIHSVEQARNASKNFHQKHAIQEQKPKRDTSFYYNWLEGEE